MTWTNNDTLCVVPPPASLQGFAISRYRFIELQRLFSQTLRPCAREMHEPPSLMGQRRQLARQAFPFRLVL
ncbi:hypothetical protein, partial [Bradyrhizobium sp. CCBAU 25360]|uniref:hypothetical protein n=1 Tax=Bradyrhizobium sp. CCBAU 25360 TaxID=858425 RepID=UPI002305F004